MKQIFYYFVSLLILSPCLWAQEPVSQILVRDAVGDVQYRTIVTPSWIPITAGVRLQERTLIRLNTPESVATFSLPDGSLLRLIGIGSFFFDYIVRPVNNTYQTKMLLMTGRWFYSSNPNSKTRMIVNTDVTTSIIENGSGGGYFFNGTNELLIRSGRGVIGYRQQDSIPVRLDENQVISFNIYDGFFRVPELATDAHYQNYLIFSENAKNLMKPEDPSFSPARPLDSAKDDPDTQAFLFYPEQKTFQSISHDVPKPPLFSGDINFDQLKILEDLSFVRRNDPLRVVIATVQPPPPLPEPKPVVNTQKVIPLSLLKPINLEDFEVPKPPMLTQAQNQPVPPLEPLQPVKPRPRPRRNPPARPLMPAASQDPQTNTPEIIDLGSIKVEQMPIVEEKEEPNIVIPRVPQAPVRRPVMVPKPVEEKKEMFTAPASFTNEFDPNASEFQYRSFEVRDLEDLLQGDFSSTIFY